MRFIIALFIIVFLSFSLPAQSATVCGERNWLVDMLKERYGEVVIGQGLMSSGTVVELLVAKAGSWSIIFVRPGGVACFLGTGESWEILSKPIDGLRDAQ